MARGTAVWAALLLPLWASALTLPRPNYSFFCFGNLSDHDFHFQQVLGRWHVVELVHHRGDASTQYEKKVEKIESCADIILRQEKERNDSIHLTWSETRGDINYNFKINDHQKPGYWETIGFQTGTLIQAVENNYKQFAGTVEVSKAVGSHMVLTFCSPSSDFYSVVLSRNKKLSTEELKGVNKMLETRQLVLYEVREICKDSASLISLNIIILISSTLILFRNHSS